MPPSRPLNDPRNLKERNFSPKQRRLNSPERLWIARIVIVVVATPQEDVEASYNEAWMDRGTKVFSNLRTSIVVDPANGRVPPLTTAAREAATARAAVQQRRPEGPEDLELWTRCILGRTSGPPMIPGAYNNNYQFVQTRDTIAIDS